MSSGRSFKLNSGYSMPAVGLGTWVSEPGLHTVDLTEALRGTSLSVNTAAIRPKRSRQGRRACPPARLPPRRCRGCLRQRGGGRRGHQGLGRPAPRHIPDLEAVEHASQGRRRRGGGRPDPAGPGHRLPRPVSHPLARRLSQAGRQERALPHRSCRWRRPCHRRADQGDVAGHGAAGQEGQGPEHRREQLHQGQD
jgi:hypothetical protein